MTPGGPAETKRQLLHISMGGFALLLRWLPWTGALALAATALAFNLFVLPRFAHAIYRPGDRTRAAHGIIFYPLAVLILIACFPGRPDIPAVAWGILAAGDGVATLAGRAIGGARWPWNPDKTIAGTLFFFLAGTCAGWALAWWCFPGNDPAVPHMFAVLVPPIAALTAALVETMPVKLDDNLSVAATAGATVWLGALVCARYAQALDHGLLLPSQRGTDTGFQSFSEVSASLAILVEAFATNVAVAAAGYAARTVNIAGAICGAIIGIAIFVSLGWQGWSLLLITFIAASVASRIGSARKQALRIAEPREGRRGAGNAIANTGVAAIGAVLAGLDVHPHAAQLAFVAALAAGGSDTIASEIGKAYGRRTFSITTFRPVPPGTSGAMSLEGTMAGVFGAAFLGGIAIGLKLLAGSSLLPVVVAATIGALVESALGATLEEPGILNNDLLNFINTAVAAGVVLILARL